MVARICQRPFTLVTFSAVGVGQDYFPYNPQRILFQLESKTTSTSNNVNILETSLTDSSPSDAFDPRGTDTTFRPPLGLEIPLRNPERGYVYRLSVRTEKLAAKVSRS